MVSSRQMALFVEAITRAGAKLVLVGDPEQLQPIEAGAAFRAIADRIAMPKLETIYRQHDQWMRDASLDLARGRVRKAVDAYAAHGRLFGLRLKDEAVESLIAAWDRDYDPSKTSLILAHLRRDVRMLNDMARAKLVERGIVADGFAFKTEDGTRMFAPGDQIVFLKNEGSLGVKNGMLAKVLEAAPAALLRRLVTASTAARSRSSSASTTISIMAMRQRSTRARARPSTGEGACLPLFGPASNLCGHDPPSRGSRHLLRQSLLCKIRRPHPDPIAPEREGDDPRLREGVVLRPSASLCRGARSAPHECRPDGRARSPRMDYPAEAEADRSRRSPRRYCSETGFARSFKSFPIQNPIMEAKPMVSGITTFPKSFEQAVETSSPPIPASRNNGRTF